MRRRIRRRTHAPVELNVIPLIDVVFFLLVFYVISTSFVSEAAVPIDRPGSAGAQPVTGGFVAVAVTRDGAIQLGEAILSLEAVPSAVATAGRQSGATRVVVVADRSVPTGRLLAVLDACRAGGIADVQVAATAP